MKANVLNDDITRGLFDADGSVLVTINFYQEQRATPFDIRVFYYFGQSLSKKDLTIKFADKFCGTVRLTESDAIFKVMYSSDEGAKVRAFLLQNPPLHPSRLHDFLLSEEILIFLNQKQNLTKKDLVTLIILAHKNFSQTKKTSPDQWFPFLQASPLELKEGQDKAQVLAMKVKKKVLRHTTTVMQHIKFSVDYIRGSFWGDGGLTVALSWKPSANQHIKSRLRCVPELTISGADKPYCQAFVHSLNMGDVNKSGQNCHKFRVSGIDNSLKVIELLFGDESLWVPQYKKQQLNLFKKALVLLQSKKHLTKDGQKELLDLVYDMSEKGKRVYTKEQYLEWGLTWLIDRGYIIK